LRPCYEDDDEAGIVSALAGGFFIEHFRSRRRITRPVRALAIPEAPQQVQQNSSVASISVTSSWEQAGHRRWVSIN